MPTFRIIFPSGFTEITFLMLIIRTPFWERRPGNWPRGHPESPICRQEIYRKPASSTVIYLDLRLLWTLAGSSLLRRLRKRHLS